jgi:hypothetical protein
MTQTHKLAVLPGPSAEGDIGIVSGFFSRKGGHSEGEYRGLNCGFGSSDRRDHVARNRQLVADWLGVNIDQLITPHQVHSADAKVVDAPWQHGEAPKLDALVTRQTGLAIAILTADCAPVLFSDPAAGVIGVAHAGWRGALNGVVGACVSAMEDAGAERGRIFATVGPCISQTAYEVGPEFEAKFLFSKGEYAAYFERRGTGQHQHFDLPAFVEHQLRDSGITQVSREDPCTYGNESLFYSYRRSQHHSERDYGRQISAIVLR